ncbi:MAG TPA: TadE/TadG family type IV pilus assembly protein [Stellaceae bacterium]|nr:TadE/TadG family type IV pilus assembly protein [Stellaceae bacterium]
MAAIEFAMLLPAFLLMFLGVVEFGRLIWTQASLQAAVETAARCLAVGSSTSPCSSSAQQTVDNQMTNYGLSAQPNVTTPTANCNGYAVSATLQFTFVVSGLFPWSPTLSAFSCYP